MLAAVAVVMVLTPRTGTGAPRQPAAWAGLLALLAGLGQTAALAWRRTRPEAVAVVVLALYAVTVVAVGLAAPAAAWVAIWTLATVVDGWGRALRAATAATGALVTLLVVGDLARPGPGGAGVLGGITVVVALAAALVRSERGRLDAARTATAAEERLRIARDLHDLVGHGLSAVAVQSSTARMALSAGDQASAVTALSGIEASSRAAMREMRQLLGVLAGGDGDRAAVPAPGLDDLPGLVDNLRAGGLAVTWETDVEPRRVSPETQLCLYRVAQEALTNYVKHAPRSPVAATLVTEALPDGTDGLRLRVESTSGSHAPHRRTVLPTEEHTGVGVEGIRARARSAGGTAVVGQTEDGWLVEVRLPLEAR